MTRSNFTPLYPPKDSEPSVWDLCIKQAAPIDQDLIKDWTETLTFLLVFAALYSGILGAFIVQSMSLLQEDTLSTQRDILLVISQQLANRSSIPYDAVPFVTPTYAIRINVCLFASISCSLVTALASIIVLQWIGNYEASLTRSSTPKDRAVRRYFRWKGAKKWKLSKIISSIVHLLYASLLLFFVGTVDWLWQINVVVAVVALAGYSLGGAFWIGTTVILTLDPSAPFRTPLSKALTLPTMESLRARLKYLLGIFSSRHRIPYEALTFHQREDRIIRNNEELEHSTVMWLFKTLDTTMANNKIYISALEYLLTLPVQTLANRITDDAPWVAIYSLLLVEHYDFGYSPSGSHTEVTRSQIKFLLITLAVIGNWEADAFIASFLEVVSREYEDLRNLADLALWKHSSDREISSFGRSLCLRLAPEMHKLPDMLVHSVIVGMRRDVKTLRMSGSLLRPMLDNYLVTLATICLAPVDSLTKDPLHPDILSTIMSIVLEENPDGARINEDPDPSEYALLTSQYPYNTDSSFISLHKAVQIQIISRLSSATTYEDALERLDPVWRMVSSTQWPQWDNPPVLTLTQELLRLQQLQVLDPDPARPEEQIPWVFKILSVALPTRYFPRRRDPWFNQNQEIALLVKSVLQGFDSLEQQTEWHPTSMGTDQARLILMRFLVECLVPYASNGKAQWSEQDMVDMNSLQDDSIYLLACAVAAFPWTRPIPKLKDALWDDPSWNLVIECCIRDVSWRSDAQNHGLIEVLRSRGYSVP